MNKEVLLELTKRWDADAASLGDQQAIDPEDVSASRNAAQEQGYREAKPETLDQEFTATVSERGRYE